MLFYFFSFFSFFTLFVFFFFNDTATTEIYTLSLHDALPIRPEQRPNCSGGPLHRFQPRPPDSSRPPGQALRIPGMDRASRVRHLQPSPRKPDPLPSRAPARSPAAGRTQIGA